MTNHCCYGPRGPLTLGPVIFFFGDSQRPRVFVSPLPRDLAELKARVIAAVKNIGAPMLTRVWQ